MADAELVELLKRDVEKWNASAWEKRKEEPLWRANLSGASLRGANLHTANLRSADLTESELTHANLKKADLTEADLIEAVLIGADLRSADLSGVNLTGANLAYSNLCKANLCGANFANCDTQETQFTQVKLVDSRGLASIRHLAPSSVDTHTLALNQGKIPEAFLKGCGLADWEIKQAKLYDPDLQPGEVVDILYEVERLRNTGPIQINPVFLSYAHEDNLFVDELQEALDKKGVRSWRDKHDAEVGPLEKVIDRAIRMNPTVLLVLSEASVESDWVGWEIEKARALEKELKRPVLCPVAIDGAWLSGLRPDLRSAVKRYAVLDLSEEGSIEREMSRILKGLQIHYREGAGDGR